MVLVGRWPAVFGYGGRAPGLLGHGCPRVRRREGSSPSPPCCAFAARPATGSGRLIPACQWILLRDKLSLAYCQRSQMPVRPSPTVRGRRLRHELRKISEEHGLTIEQVSERSDGDWNASTISR